MQKTLKYTIGLSTVIALTSGCASREANQSDGPRRLMLKNQRQSSPRGEDLPEMPQILPETHFAAGQLFEAQGAYDKAIAQYRRAVAVNHNFASGYHRLGLALSATGRHEEAIDAIAKAVALKPENAVLRNNLAYEYMHLKRWEHAERELEKAIELQPTLARAHINLGLTRARTGRFESALVDFKSVLPEADAHYNLGLLYRGQQRYAEAADAFRTVLTIDPGFTAARTQLEQVSALVEKHVAAQRQAAGMSDRPDNEQEIIEAPMAWIPDFGAAASDDGQQATAPPTTQADGWVGLMALVQMLDNEANCTHVPAVQGIVVSTVDSEDHVDSADDAVVAEGRFENELQTVTEAIQLPIDAEWDRANIGSDVFDEPLMIDDPVEAIAEAQPYVASAEIEVNAAAVVGPLPDELGPIFAKASDFAPVPAAERAAAEQTVLRQMADLQAIGEAALEELDYVLVAFPSKTIELVAASTRPHPVYQGGLGGLAFHRDTWFDDFGRLDGLVAISHNETICLQTQECDDQDEMAQRAGADDRMIPAIDDHTTEVMVEQNAQPSIAEDQADTETSSVVRLATPAIPPPLSDDQR